MTTGGLRRWAVVSVAVAALGGCGSGGGNAGAPDGTDRQRQQAHDDADRQRQQARAALERYGRAVAGGRQGFVPVEELTGMRGEWEPANGDHKMALESGRIRAVATLPAAPAATGRLTWKNGDTLNLPLISAARGLSELTSAATGRCPECVPLSVIDARLGTTTVRTTRGPATVPTWEYELKGTAVRVTRVAVTGAVTVTPPSWDPYDAPGGLSIDSATIPATTGTRLTVAFTGAPEPASRPCGIDYTAEAVESAAAVVVIVHAHPHATGENCTAIGAGRTATVDLARPLGERAVLEVQQGLPVELTTTG